MRGLPKIAAPTPAGKRSVRHNIYGNVNGYISGKFWVCFGKSSHSWVIEEAEEWLKEGVSAQKDMGVSMTCVPANPTLCKECGGKNLFWFTTNTHDDGISQGRLNTSDIQCLFVLGCEDCSETVLVKRAAAIAKDMNDALHNKIKDHA